MLVREETIKQFVKRYFGPTLAAAALMTGAGAAQAQFNQVNAFNPAGPTILQPLGGGVLSNLSLGTPGNTFTTGFGSTLGSGFGSFNNGFNAGFTLPLNSSFNTQLNAFNAQRFVDTTGFSNFNSQLANFNAQRTAYNARFIQQNSALNVPSLNVPGSGNTSVFTGFVPTPTITNPSLNPAASANTSFGFSGFNTFNPLASLNNSPSVPVTASALSTRAFVNSQVAARTSRISSAAANNVTTRANGVAYPWPTQPAPQTYPPVMYIHQPSATTSRTYPWPTQPAPTTYPPVMYIHQSAAAAPTYPWPAQPAPRTYPPVLYIHSPLGAGSGVAARSAFSSGIGASSVVMGGRSVR